MKNHTVLYIYLKSKLAATRSNSFKLTKEQNENNWVTNKENEEISKEFKNFDDMGDDNKEKSQNSINSFSNINSPNFKIDSLIGDSEIKDTNILIDDIVQISQTPK